MSNLCKIGIDVGYGYTKVVQNGVSRMFPSKVGPAMEMNFSLKEGVDAVGEVIELGGKQYFVGDKARHCDIVFELRTRDWIQSDMYGALLSSAITRASYNDKTEADGVLIVTGLPVDYMKDKTKAEDTVRKVCMEMKVKVAGVNVIPQPLGSFLDAFYDNHGLLNIEGTININNIKVKRLGVIDIGYHTTDFILIEDSKHYIERASGSVPTGAHEIYDIIAKELRNNFSLDNVSADDAETVVKTKRFKAKGQLQDTSYIVHNVLSQIGLKLSGLIKSKWSTAGEVDEILLTGGGGALLQSYIDITSHSPLLVEYPQTANARGYYKRAVILDKNLIRGRE